MATKAQRRHRVSWVLAVTAGTTLAPGPYECQLLEQYVRGVLTLAEISELLDGVEAARWPYLSPQVLTRRLAPPAMTSENLPLYFANTAGQVQAHPDGYGIICYQAGQRREGELLALLTQAGHLLRTRGWDRLLSDQRRMSPYTEAERAVVATYWINWQRTYPGHLYMAIVAAPS